MTYLDLLEAVADDRALRESGRNLADLCAQSGKRDHNEEIREVTTATVPLSFLLRQQLHNTKGSSGRYTTHKQRRH